MWRRLAAAAATASATAAARRAAASTSLTRSNTGDTKSVLGRQHPEAINVAALLLFGLVFFEELALRPQRVRRLGRVSAGLMQLDRPRGDASQVRMVSAFRQKLPGGRQRMLPLWW